MKVGRLGSKPKKPPADKLCPMIAKCISLTMTIRGNIPFEQLLQLIPFVGEERGKISHQ